MCFCLQLLQSAIKIRFKPLSKVGVLGLGRGDSDPIVRSGLTGNPYDRICCPLELRMHSWPSMTAQAIGKLIGLASISIVACGVGV